jgi:phosphoribosylanthranilate isomerase
MRDAANIGEMGALHPDYMGFIFFRGSKRFVGDQFRIPDDLSPTIKRVGVFVNEGTEKILQVASDNQLDYAQLHGDESPEECRFLHQNGLGVIKAFNVDNNFDFHRTLEYVGAVDFFLFDAKGGSRGGNGLRFDWKKLEEYDQQVPFFLAGGISPSDIEHVSALKGMNLHAIDVNSGVERSPASKDKKLVMELIDKMKAYAI